MSGFCGGERVRDREEVGRKGRAREGTGGGEAGRGGGGAVGLDKPTQRERESRVTGDYVQISRGCRRRRSG